MERGRVGNKIKVKRYDYSIGIKIEKNALNIIFTTYTLYCENIVLNHESTHELNGKISHGKINNLDGTFITFTKKNTENVNFIEKLIDNFINF